MTTSTARFIVPTRLLRSCVFMTAISVTVLSFRVFGFCVDSPCSIRRRTSKLFAGSKKDLSAADRERRDEEERRRKRKDDVVIGKTSAKKGEKDFALDPKATEQEYLRQATNVEREVFRLTEAGMELLNSVSKPFSWESTCLSPM